MADWFKSLDDKTARIVPKAIDQDTHAILDYLTISAFFTVAGASWISNKRASIAAMINGFMVLGVSMFTDYSGAAKRVIPFETHGKLDAVQMAMAATMPTLMGFSDTKAATFFHGQALNEANVIMLTDWSRRNQRTKGKRAA
ncbi:MAG: hypothetical protein ACRDQZ_05380 [Mycobacteriales bacterium]